MENKNNRYAWYCIRTNPAVWVLGRYEQDQIVDIQAQISRAVDHAWRWCVFIPYMDGRVALPTGVAAVFETARQQAELTLRASL